MGFSIATPTPKTTTETTTPCTIPLATTEGPAETVAAEARARSKAIDSCVQKAKVDSPTAPYCTAKIAERFGDYTGEYLFDEVTVTCTSEEPVEEIMRSIDYSGEFYKKTIIPFEHFIFMQPNPVTTSYATPGRLYDFSWLLKALEEAGMKEAATK